jgi:hypothetical protein
LLCCFCDVACKASASNWGEMSKYDLGALHPAGELCADCLRWAKASHVSQADIKQAVKKSVVKKEMKTDCAEFVANQAERGSSSRSPSRGWWWRRATSARSWRPTPSCA